MCIRNYIDQDNLEIRNALDAFGHKERISTDEVSSASIVSVLTAQREPQVMQWGSNCLGIKDRVFYVQSETVMDSSMFQDSIRERRCLVPVSWYLELKNIDTEPEKRPPTRLPEQRIFYIAGIYQEEKDESFLTFSILTREVSLAISGVDGSRMPVILHKVLKPLWLHGSNPQKLFEFAEQRVPPE